LTRLTAALRILLAGLVAARVRIRAIVAGLVLTLLVLLPRLLTQMRLILLTMLLALLGGSGFAMIVIVGVISHEWILLDAMIQPMEIQPIPARHVPRVAPVPSRLCT